MARTKKDDRPSDALREPKLLDNPHAAEHTVDELLADLAARHEADVAKAATNKS